MTDVLSTIGGTLSVASAVDAFTKAIAEAISGENLRVATKLAGLMSDISTHASIIRSLLRRASKAKGKETKEALYGLALERTELMLLAIRNVIRVLTKIWSKPSIIERMLRWVMQRRHTKSGR